MAAILPSLQRFALLNSDSNRSEVTESVALLITDLRITIGKNEKPGAARKSVADLLNFLHELKSTVHPGRAPLAQAISSDILPLLYEEDIKPDNYKYLKAEQAFANHVGILFKRTLDFLRADTPEHPAYGKSKVADSLPAFCFFDAKYAKGIQEFMSSAIKARLRIKKIENNIYRPLMESYIKTNNNPAEFFEKNDEYIRAQMGEVFDWGTKIRARISDKAKPNSSTSGENTEYSPEEVTCLELLDKLKLHSEHNGYFLPQCAGFRFLRCLINLNQKRFIKSFNTITNAMVHGENHDYIIRQVDRLSETLDTFEFDLVTLCHHNLGDEEERLSFRTLQDSCIGAARERSLMMVNRPMIAAELGRRPVHLAKEICLHANNKADSIDGIRLHLEEFTANISRINKIRFEPEIKVCAGMFLGNKSLKILANWIEKENADEGLIFLRVQQVETALKKKWQIK